MIVGVVSRDNSTYTTNLTLQPQLMDQIRQAYSEDSRIKSWIDDHRRAKRSEFEIRENILWFQERIYVPRVKELQQVILGEAHQPKYSIHPGATKMYKYLKAVYWWPRMKKSVVRYVSQCDTCQRIKIKHQKQGGSLQPLKISEWKWEHITMNFVTGLPRSPKGNNAIWVIVDRLSKSVHFWL